jgi:transglutaminase/protease-like cytokinesis protein 3
VKIQGEFRFIDVGCASPSHPLNEKKEPNWFYFLTLPDELIYTHFPTDSVHQYLQPPVPVSLFYSLPYIQPAYFDCGVHIVHIGGSLLEMKGDDTTLIVMVVNSGVGCFSEIELPDGDRIPTLSQCCMQGNQRLVKVWVRMKGERAHGFLRIYLGLRDKVALLLLTL